MPAQMSIVRGGRKRKPTYTDMINAQTPYLYPMKEAAEEKAFREKQFALDEESQRRTEEINLENLEEMKKQNRTANLLKFGELGLSTGFGIAGLSPGPTGTPHPLKAGLSKFGTSLKKPSTYAAGGIGALGSRLLGKDESSSKKALMGMGIGAGSSALLGLLSGKSFDPYQTIVSGVLGGLGSLI